MYTDEINILDMLLGLKLYMLTAAKETSNKIRKKMYYILEQYKQITVT